MTGYQFEAWRKSMGFLQTQAAEAIGESRRTVQRYEEAGEGQLPVRVELVCVGLFADLMSGAKAQMYATIEAGFSVQRKA